MFEKMFSLMGKMCKTANAFLGIDINFPRPNKSDWKISSISNAIFGIVFLALGIFTKYTWLLIIGIIGIVGSVLTNKFAK